MKLFTDWLLEQQHRHDPVGDLAWEAAHDDDWPAHADRYVDIHNYLVTQDAGESTHRAAHQAWAEFTPIRNVLAANAFFDALWCDQPRAAPDVAHREVHSVEPLATTVTTRGACLGNGTK